MDFGGGADAGADSGDGADVGAAQASKLTANSNDRIISISGTIDFRFTSVPPCAFNPP